MPSEYVRRRLEELRRLRNRNETGGQASKRRSIKRVVRADSETLGCGSGLRSIPPESVGSRTDTAHERAITRVQTEWKGPSWRRSGFTKAVARATYRKPTDENLREISADFDDAEVSLEEIRPATLGEWRTLHVESFRDLPRIVPDLYRIDTTARAVHCVEVVDTHGLKVQKLMDYCHWQSVVEDLGWDFRLWQVEAKTFGSFEVDLHEWDLENIVRPACKANGTQVVRLPDSE